MSNAERPVRKPAQPPDPPPGFIRPPHGGIIRAPWQKGVSPNPGGRGGEYHETVSLARKASPDAMRKLIAKMDSDDERVAVIAMQGVLERAWGKPKEMDPKDFDRARPRLDLTKLSPEQIAVLVEITRSVAIMPADPQPTIDAPGDVRGGDR
jgi:hypothetical protein